MISEYKQGWMAYNRGWPLDTWRSADWQQGWWDCYYEDTNNGFLGGFY